MSCDGPSSTGLLQGSSSSIEPVLVGAEQVQFSGRNARKKPLPDNKKKSFPPAVFFDYGFQKSIAEYRKGIANRTIRMMTGTIIASNGLSMTMIPRGLEAMVIERVVDNMYRLRGNIQESNKRCGQALEGINDHSNIHLQSVKSQQDSTNDQNKTAAGEISSHHKYNMKRKVDADAAVATSVHTSQTVADKQHPTTSKMSIVKHSHQGVAPIKKRRVPTEKTINFPLTVETLVDDIQAKMIAHREEKGGGPKNIISCWYTLTSGVYGDAVKELLMTVVVDGQPDRLKIHQLQERIKKENLIEGLVDDEDKNITQAETDDLKEFIQKSYFNTRFVCFSFKKFISFLKKINSDREDYDIPDRLFWLGDEIRAEINRKHFEKGGMRLTKEHFFEVINHGRCSQLIIELMSAITSTALDRLSRLIKLQDTLDEFLKNQVPFVSSSFDGRDGKITEKEVTSLKGYLFNVCIKYDLMDISFDKIADYFSSLDENKAK